MITIYYYYRKDGRWVRAEKIFYSVESASRFCWSMKTRKLILDGWATFDPEDNAELQRRVDIAKINGWRMRWKEEANDIYYSSRK